jgi:VWFA-related protein
MRVLVLAAAALAGSPALVADSGDERQEHHDIPTFKSQVELVTVDAVVLDGKGQPVRGLTAQDFTLLEDGKPQTIASFEAFDLGANTVAVGEKALPGPVATNLRRGRTGASFVLLVDDLSLAPERADAVRGAVRRFLADGVRDGDEVILATTSGETWWSGRMPDDREDLLAVADHVRGRKLAQAAKDAMSEWEAYRITHVEGVEDYHDLIVRNTEMPGSSMTGRVFDRYCRTYVCNCEYEEGARLCVVSVRNKAQQVEVVRRSRTRSVSDTLDRAVSALTGVRGRKALLLLTEGFLDDSDEGVIRLVAGRCREANIAVYSLDVRGLMGALDRQSAADVGLVVGEPTQQLLGQVEQTEFQAAGNVGLAEETGGFAARNTNDLAGAAVRVGEESRVYYLLAYAPPEGKGPRDWRKVKVEVQRPGVEVRARKGYTLRTRADIQAAADAQVEAKSRQAKSSKGGGAAADPPLPTDVARALANGRTADAIPLRAMAYVLEGRANGTVRTVFAVEADMKSIANLGGDDRPRSVLNLSIFATHRDSGKTRRLDQRVVVDNGTFKADAAKAWNGWLTLSRDLDLPPGVNQARIVVRDEFLGRLGAVTLRFVVPAETGFRLSTPLITDRLIAEKAGTVSHPVLVAHREFDPRTPVYCQFQVYGATSGGGAGPLVLSSYELRESGGTVLRRGEPSPMPVNAEGRLVGLLALPAEGMPEGDYELLLRVEDKTTGQVREQAESLRVGAPLRGPL